LFFFFFSRSFSRMLVLLLLFGLCFGQVSDENYRYFAVGRDAVDGGPGVVMKSLDGIFWTNVSTNVFNGQDAGYLYSVGVGNGVWLAFGPFQKKYRSLRGNTFDVSFFPGTYKVECLVFGANMWIACDSKAEDGVPVSGLLYSVDEGQSFTRPPANFVGIRDVVYADVLGIWVGVGAHINTSFPRSGISLDGIIWDYSESNSGSLIYRLFSVTFSVNLRKFVAVGLNRLVRGQISPIIASDDGKNWVSFDGTGIDLETGNDVSVADLGNGEVVIVVVGKIFYGRGKRSQIVVSYDRGVTWIGKGVFFSIQLNSSEATAVCYNALDNRFVVVGEGNEAGDGPVVFSDDLGRNWKYGSRSSDNLLGRKAFDIATYDLRSFVAQTFSSILLAQTDVTLLSTLTLATSASLNVTGKLCSLIFCFRVLRLFHRCRAHKQSDEPPYFSSKSAYFRTC